MNNIRYFPRSIYFLNDKAVGSHPVGKYDKMRVISLPSDHYDFLGPINIYGKTEQEIKEESKTYSIYEETK